MNKIERMPSRLRDKRVVMTVNNDCIADTRVIKTAQSLSDAGARVMVVCPVSARAPRSTQSKGVEYIRIGHIDVPIYEPPPLIPIPVTGIRRYIRYGLSIGKKAGRFAKRGLKSVYKPVRSFLRDSYAADLRRINIITGKKFAAMAAPVVWELRPDVIHCHDLATLLCGVEVGRLTGVPVIYDAHELETERNATYNQRVWDAIANRERELISECAGVITVSESIASHLQIKYELDTLPTVTFNAPAPKSSTPDYGRTIRDVCGVTPQTTLAVYVGLISVNRGLEDCVKSLIAGDHHLALVGPYNEAFLDDLLLHACELGVSQRLHVVDAVAPDQVPAFISTADASLILLPRACVSYEYAMPNKLFESMLAGVPVIATSRKDMADFVKKHDCGIVVDLPTPSEVALSIHHVKTNRDWFTTKEPVTWSEQDIKLIRLYGDVLQDDRARLVA